MSIHTPPTQKQNKTKSKTKQNKTKQNKAKGRELNSAANSASQPAAGHSLSFIITIVIITLGCDLFVGLAAESCGQIWLPRLTKTKHPHPHTPTPAHTPTPQPKTNQKYRYIKGTISDRTFQTSLFSKPTDFLHIQRKLHCSSLPIYNKSPENSIVFFLGGEDNSLLLGINYRRR